MSDERPGGTGKNNFLKGAVSVFYGLPDSLAKRTFRERYGAVLGIAENDVGEEARDCSVT
jgi:hypothetical protein